MSKIHMCTQLGSKIPSHPPATVAAANQSQHPPPLGLALDKQFLWKNGTTIRVKFYNNPSEKMRRKIRQIATEWTAYANLSFLWVGDTEDSNIRISVNNSGESWSIIGNNSLLFPDNQRTMVLGSLNEDSPNQNFSNDVLHEFGHALGCIHEHKSPASGIQWNKEAAYAYFMKRNPKWDRADVEANVFDKAEESTTQFSEFDKNSIMIYNIPPELTLDGYSTPWNIALSPKDKEYIAKIYPGRNDPTTFNTNDIRTWEQKWHDNQVTKTFGYSLERPKMVTGLNYLDIGNENNVRVKTWADNITNTSATIHVNSWSDTSFYGGGCTWFRAAANDPDFQMGEFSTTEDHPWSQPRLKTSRRIAFSKPFPKTPNVVVWLSGFDMVKDKNYRVSVQAADIDKDGFTIQLNTTSDTLLYAATATWIAYPADKPNIASGTVSIADTRRVDSPQLINGGWVNFPKDLFWRAPNVLIAFNSIDADCSKVLRARLWVDNITPGSMDWHIFSWVDSILYSGGASWIAFT